MKTKNVALVTGASFGIGEALSRELISQGWIVIGLDFASEKLNLLKNQIGPSFIPVVCNVSSQPDVRRASQSILDQNLCPSVFFLNAAIHGKGALENPSVFEVQMHERIMAVNYFGVLAFVEFFEKPCLKNGGAHFIVTSSVNAIFAPPLGSAYSASKAAISKAFESLSLKYFGKNLRFSSIYAGPVATGTNAGNWRFEWKPEKMAKYMCKFSATKKSRGYPSRFYFIIFHLLRLLPDRVVMYILRNIRI